MTGGVSGISVVVAAFQAARTVADALESALSQVPPPLEVVVCDDASDDGTAEVLRGFGERIRVVTHPTNRGEAAAKNSAARAARGSVIVFLDADDVYLPGRLAAIGQRLESDPGADVVTTDAVLVADGRDVGRWYTPEHAFPASGQRLAVLDRNFVFGHAAVRRDAFLAHGGFDEDVRHATDWDLWIRMVLGGSRVALVDRALSRYGLHGASASADRLAMQASAVRILERVQTRDDLSVEERLVLAATLRRRRALQAREHLKVALRSSPDAEVRRRSRVVLEDRAQPLRSRAAAAVALAATTRARRALAREERDGWAGPGGRRLERARTPRPRAFVTLADDPATVNGGKRLRAAVALEALSQVADLDVVVLARPGEDPVLPLLQVEYLPVPPRPRWRSLLGMALELVPLQIAGHDWRPVQDHVRRRATGVYDLVWFGSMDHALRLNDSVRSRAVVIDVDDVETTKSRAFFRVPKEAVAAGRRDRWQRAIELPLWWRIQRWALRTADAVVVCSELDRVRMGSRRVAVVPNTYRVVPPELRRRERDPGHQPTLAMMANYSYEPNVDAALFAVTEVLPLVRRLVPDVRLQLIGRGPGARLRAMEGTPGLEIVGRVPDAVEALRQVDVALAPVRFGGGTRIKLLEAFACGLPVVATPLAAEGLDVVDGTHLLLRESPDGLAEACAALLTDPARAERIAEAALELFDQRFHPERAWTAIQDLVAHLLRGDAWTRA